jgi:hypothetical protein
MPYLTTNDCAERSRLCACEGLTTIISGRTVLRSGIGTVAKLVEKRASRVS